MVFGDTHRFAIELELHSKPAGIWMNGRACYWISGEQVGDYKLFDSLRDVLFRWERMSYDQDRFNEELYPMNTQELITTLYCGLYSGCVDEEVYQRRSLEGTWARHNINPGTAGFSGWSIFLVEGRTAARCLYAFFDDSTSHGRDQSLHLGEFNQVLDDAIAYLLKVYHGFGGT